MALTLKASGSRVWGLGDRVLASLGLGFLVSEFTVREMRQLCKFSAATLPRLGRVRKSRLDAVSPSIKS